MRLTFFLLFLTFFLSCWSQPSWVTPIGRSTNFPASEYVIGFTSRHYEPGEKLNDVVTEVRNYSRISLSESVYLNVNSTSKLTIQNQNGVTTENFEKNSITQSNLETFGLVTEDYVDKLENVAYGFSYVSVKKLKTGYYKMYSSRMSEIKRELNDVLDIPDNEVRYQRLEKLLNQLIAAKSFQEMLYFMGVTNDAVLMSGDWKNYQHMISEELDNIRYADNLSLNQSIAFLVDHLKQDIGERTMSVNIQPITFKNTGIATEFSEYFNRVFERQAADKFDVVTNQEAQFKFTGNYWVVNNQVQITINLHEYDGKEPFRLIVGGAISIEESFVRDLDLQYKLDATSYDQIRHFQLMQKGAVNGGLITDLTTQKGNKSLIFHEGDELKLFINLSRPAYIRLINIWADGSQLSLLDNYYIGDSRLNQLIETDFVWRTACPCGTEYIKLIAQSEPFESMMVEDKDGLEYIIGDLGKVLEKSRSVQETKQKESEFYYGESGLVLTSLPNKVK